MTLEVNWTQVFAQGLVAAVISPITTISAFIAMRYFPKVVLGVEKIIKKTVNTANPKNNQENKGG